MHVDDVKLFAKKEKKMNTLIKAVRICSEEWYKRQAANGKWQNE